MNEKQYKNCMKWVRALRSGMYVQGRNRMLTPEDDHNKYCCLGVAAERVMHAKRGTFSEFKSQGLCGFEGKVFEEKNSSDLDNVHFIFPGENIAYYITIPNNIFKKTFGLSKHVKHRLLVMNDSISPKYYFSDIANVIEAIAEIKIEKTEANKMKKDSFR